MTLLVFGMDGAVREYVEEAIDRGLMPNMEQLIEEGAFGDMKSCTPPVTIPAWVSMFSGCRPGSLGIYHMTYMDEDHQRRSVDSSLWKGKMLWDRLDGEFGLVNVPGTSPLWPVNGYVLEGFPMVENPEVYPESLKEELPEFDFVEKDAQQTKSGRRKAMFKNFRKRKEIFGEIDRSVDARLEVIQLTDTSAHRSKNLDQVLEAYSEVDEVLGERMEEFDDILLVSDHGFMHIDRMFYINTWLEEHGYLQQKEGDSSGSGKSVMDRLQSTLAPLAETPLRPVLKLANDLLRKNTSVDFSPKANGIDRIDFEKTDAFSFRGGATNYGEINLEDPEVKQEIIEELEKEEFVDWVKPREAVYDEPDEMPEIIFKTRESVGVGSSLFPKTVLETDAFIHSDTGIVGALGPSFREGEIEDARIYDVAPTVARYLGQELECDGKALDVFADDFEPRKPEESELGGIDV